MARGTFDDFTDKYGFNDGASSEERDFAARDILVGMLNALPDFADAGLRVLAFDRAGMHNGCMILMVPNPEGLSDVDLLAAAEIGQAQSVQFTPEGDYELEELIGEAYAEADHA